MKINFKINIIIDKQNLKNFKIHTKELKDRVKFVLSLMSDFSQEVSFRFCDRQEMIDANNAYRKKKSATDVLSFPADFSQSKTKYNYLGDVLICVPVCFEQAKKAKVTLSQELEKMLIHSLVHLKGFDHERNKSAWKVMNCLEVAIQEELVKHYKKPKWSDDKGSS